MYRDIWISYCFIDISVCICIIYMCIYIYVYICVYIYMDGDRYMHTSLFVVDVDIWLDKQEVGS